MTGTAVVVGDIMLDVRATMTHDRYSSAVDHESAVDGRIAFTLAGTGVNMARALTGHFASVQLIGAYGRDSSGDLIERLLAHEQFTTLASQHMESTGIALVLRDAARRDAPHGDRIVIADRDANDSMTTTDLAAHEQAIASADLLCVDGYGLLHEPRRTATLHAMRLARQAGHHVFCDLVPHNIDRHFTLDHCQAWLADATIIGTSGTTLARLLQLPVDPASPLDHTTAMTVATQAAEHLNIPTQLVRFGYGHCSWSLAFHRDTGPIWCEPTTYQSLPADQLAGFGDTLTAHELHRLRTPEPLS